MSTPTALAGALLVMSLPAAAAQAQDHAQHARHHASHAAAQDADTGHGGQHRHPPAAEHAGHDRPAMDHAHGHAVPVDPAAHAVDPQHAAAVPAPPPTGLPVPMPTDADRAAAFPDLHGHATHDQRVVGLLQFNRLETWHGDEASGQAWEAQGWVGTDWNRLWLRSEGERTGGHTESADLELMYGRPVARWWDLVAGLRHDIAPGAGRTFAGIGVVGMAPYMFEVSATAYVGEGGQTAARVEVEYETLLTNRLILQSQVEAEAWGEDDPRRGIGSGLATLEAGFRLRYEVTRRFAPYLGIAWERTHGGSADLRRADGGPEHDTRVVAGLRFWF
ncbi:copper resistance protein B [Coralloluteibacterium stylophorae]|uniref:Copper resistance protein B n=1 Tax=Coralloluteibacterium stylophorae TaxID=1776034 RepID=A0A8J7VUK8_9GAMM|nr:copper resistance protein B [Coralloluteibacterium stylophorae]MBS7458834.1 copper resistance protein B [Coralloluteibacterium stylophorae]